MWKLFDEFPTHYSRYPKIIEREQLIGLNQHDALMLVEALDKPIKTHPKLVAANKNYNQKQANAN